MATLSRRARDVVERAFERTSDGGKQSPLVQTKLQVCGARDCQPLSAASCTVGLVCGKSKRSTGTAWLRAATATLRTHRAGSLQLCSSLLCLIAVHTAGLWLPWLHVHRTDSHRWLRTLTLVQGLRHTQCSLLRTGNAQSCGCARSLTCG